jgi:glycerol-3-phosphate dehydrogenase
MADDTYDLVVIGGGINGAGIAADAAARGLKVLLAEAEDLASATSSASSKLIHGGLRYLEHLDFRLVREALAEREVLLRKAPHIVWPLRFILPHVRGMRPRVLIRAGLFLYDHLALRHTLGGSRSINLENDPAGLPLAGDLKSGFAYWDCAVDDARLVVLNAIAAREAGATILTRTPVRGLEPHDGIWTVTLGMDARRVSARTVVNAAGPWVGEVAKLVSVPHTPPLRPIRMVQGSHIVVPRIAGAQDAYTFQHSDRRVVFALPFEYDFTLFGTTERALTGDPRSAAVSEDEERYLLSVANRFFRSAPRPDQIVWRFAGVRPLEETGKVSASALSRDYHLRVETISSAPILYVIGGKITTYRKLAETALDLLKSNLPPLRRGATATTPLPGGDLGGMPFETWFADLALRHAGFDRGYLYRLARRHGERVARIIEGATSEQDLGEDLGGGLRLREIVYLKSEEWAQTADDVLWRRTKAGLHIAPENRARVAEAVQACLDKA